VRRLGPRELGRRVAERHGTAVGARAVEVWRACLELGDLEAPLPPGAGSSARLARLHRLAKGLFPLLAPEGAALRDSKES
jgi:hypothetical protein